MRLSKLQDMTQHPLQIQHLDIKATTKRAYNIAHIVPRLLLGGKSHLTTSLEGHHGFNTHSSPNPSWSTLRWRSSWKGLSMVRIRSPMSSLIHSADLSSVRSAARTSCKLNGQNHKSTGRWTRTRTLFDRSRTSGAGLCDRNLQSMLHLQGLLR